ncbi:MAG: EamA family transporter [Sandaracinaceae bacterium]|nr:EamA family transporter [Sandaracinaceae bacterium]
MTKRLERWGVPVALAAVYLIWGSTFAAISVAVRELPPFSMAGLRWLVAGGALYAWLRLRGAPRPSAATWRHAGIGGALLILGGNGLVCWAEARVDSGLAATLLAVTPLLVIVFEWLAFGGERPPARTWAGVVAGLVGVGVLVGPRMSSELGAVAALGLAAVCWAFGALHARRAPRVGPIGSATQMIAGGALLAVTGLATGEPLPTEVSVASWLALAYLAAFGSIVGFGAYLYLTTRVRPSTLATHSFVNPVIAVLLGWLLLGEPFDTRSMVGAALVVLSVAAIVTRPRPSVPALARPVATSR